MAVVVRHRADTIAARRRTVAVEARPIAAAAAAVPLRHHRAIALPLRIRVVAVAPLTQAEVRAEAIAAVVATAAEEEVPAAVVAEAQDASNKQFNKYNYEKDGNYTFADDCRSIRICPDSI